MIYFDNVTKVYPGNDLALENITLSIDDGEFVSVVGHSGAGKTTMVRLILGEVHPTSGNLSFESQDISDMDSSQVSLLRRRIGTVFQDFKLLPNKTAYENIAFAMEVAGRSDEDVAADVPHVLDLVNLSQKRDRFPRELSGGERQRLSIARAIVNQPDVIIADEPTGNLDPEATYEIIQILQKINELGTTVILTTHSQGVVDSLKKRVIRLEEGRIISDTKASK
ncbi:MAG: cell division ATP-binding protein FtsE [Candidatus Pacebacteria bacterium]|nr:cell division ATP-binding protein FtsE [Candidatus Paceibacterota bacterium]